MKDWISLIWQGHVWGHIEDTFKPSNFFLFRHFYSFEHILTEEYLIFIHTINITKNQMILVMSCFVVLKRRNWFELRIYSGSDWAQCVETGEREKGGFTRRNKLTYFFSDSCKVLKRNDFPRKFELALTMFWQDRTYLRVQSIISYFVTKFDFQWAWARPSPWCNSSD